MDSLILILIFISSFCFFFFQWVQTAYFGLAFLNDIFGSNTRPTAPPRTVTSLERLRNKIHACCAFPMAAVSSGSYCIVSYSIGVLCTCINSYSIAFHCTVMCCLTMQFCVALYCIAM